MNKLIDAVESKPLFVANSHTTVAFKRVGDKVRIQYQRTLDPDEDLDTEYHINDEAEEIYYRLLREGYSHVSGWHRCSARHAWYPDGE